MQGGGPAMLVLCLFTYVTIFTFCEIIQTPSLIIGSMLKALNGNKLNLSTVITIYVLGILGSAPFYGIQFENYNSSLYLFELYTTFSYSVFNKMYTC